MRQLKLPFELQYFNKSNGGNILTIDAKFKNTIVSFKSTSLNTMLRDAKVFIEEMSDQYKIDKSYKPNRSSDTT